MNNKSIYLTPATEVVRLSAASQVLDTSSAAPAPSGNASRQSYETVPSEEW